MHLLLVENYHPAGDQNITRMLTSDGAIVEHATTADGAVELARRQDYDLILLDLQLLDNDTGYQVIQRMRLAKINTPILAISTLTDPPYKVKALTLGADDYLVSPVDRGELLARIKAIVRRCHGFSGSIIRVGPLELNLATDVITMHNAKLALTRSEYTLLQLFMLRSGAVLTREYVWQHLYNSVSKPMDIKNFNVMVHRLRKKLIDAGPGVLIDTVWGRGYILQCSPEHPEALVAA
jgi:two-component system cell cycle response regulator CtrA